MIGSYSEPMLARQAVNRYFDEHNNNAKILPDVVTAFSLGPGDGLYIPPYAVHWVGGGPEASVGVSCGFRTRLSERTNLVHVCNARLRRVGLHPSPPGDSESRDRAKLVLLVSGRRIRRAIAPVTSRARRLTSRSAYTSP